MRHLPNEEELTILNVNHFVLSNYRVEKQEKDWGESSLSTIFLEDISSIEMRYTSTILYLFLGVLFVLAGFFVAVHFEINAGMIIGLIVGGIFFALWAFTRKHVIIISPNGGAPMKVDIAGMPNDKVLDVIHSVSLAKLTRVHQLNRINL